MEACLYDLEALILRLKQSVKNFKKTGASRRTKSYLTNRLADAHSLWEQLKIRDLDLRRYASSKSTSEAPSFDPDEFEQIEELYFDYIGDLGDCLQTLEDARRPSLAQNSHTEQDPVSGTQSHRMIGLPAINLPTFDGRFESWQSFKDLFVSLVHNRVEVPTVNKLHYLKSCLSGESAQLLRNFSITESNYSEAWDFLNNRYDNKRILVSKHLNRFLNQSLVSSENSTSLRTLLDTTREVFIALKSLSIPVQHWDAIIVHVVSQKLPKQSLQLWEQGLLSATEVPTYDELILFLESRCRTLDMIHASTVSQAGPKFSSLAGAKAVLSTPPIKSARVFKATNTPNNRNNRNNRSSVVPATSCAVCHDNSHRIHKCPVFLEKSVGDRFNLAKQLALCINCLASGHTVSSCDSTRCRICSGNHHSLLHRGVSSSSSSNGGPSSITEPRVSSPSAGQVFTSTAVNLNRSSSETSSAAIASSSCKRILLATAVIEIRDRFGTSRLVRALLDSGSQLNFMSSRLFQCLGLKGQRICGTIHGVGNTSTNSRTSTTTGIASRLRQYHATLQFVVVPSITGTLPDTAVASQSWNLPKNVELADPTFFEPSPIDLLLGAEVFFEVLAVGQVRLGPGLPILQKTLFGWLVSGPYNSPTSNILGTSLMATEDTALPSSSIEDLVQKFWQLEHVPSEEKILTNEQALCENIFHTTTRRNSSGRLIVRLPFKANGAQLGESRYVAERRFYNLERRLAREPALRVQYSDFMAEYLDLDHMELVPKHMESDVKYYLPHHCVLKSESSSTKLRVVFDGSSKTSSTFSLNDLLLVGPVVQQDLFSILLRFRCHQYALKADIAKMYRQFLVATSDSYYQCILWRNEETHELRTFRLKTVTYGTACASYLATKSLCYLADFHSHDRPRGSLVIGRDFYVDDLLTGGSTLQEIQQIQTEVDSILKSAGLELKKWYSNDSCFLDAVPAKDREQLLEINGTSILKTLGTAWQPHSDSLRFVTTPCCRKVTTLTKRTVLSHVAQLFDPLGLINPVIVKAKIFLQSLWLLKLNWDESLPQQHHTEWLSILEDFPRLQEISVPRFAFPSTLIKMQLHGFADASSRAYGCCIYARSLDTAGKYSVHLLAAKSRVAPVRVVSIPRLELCAALLLANLLLKVQHTVTIQPDEIYCWTDSEVVLDWLSTHASRWPVFVANRVSKIQELTEQAKWRHVPSKANAADLLSRGCSVSELIQSTWFSGPAFLTSPSDAWPQPKQQSQTTTCPTNVSINSSSFVARAPMLDNLVAAINNFSNYHRILRAVSYIRRFSYNRKTTVSKLTRSLRVGPYSALELDLSLLKVVEVLQRHSFPDEISSLNRSSCVSKSSCLRSLNPFLDSQSTPELTLIRVGGRLRNSTLPYDAQCPILLPSRHNFVRVLVRHIHQLNCHAGPQSLLAFVRQRFWLVNGRKFVTRTVNECLHCFMYRPRLQAQLMGDLPRNRVDPSRPFLRTGVDFCGPVQVSSGSRGRHAYKAYISVFTCFVTHSIHLEVISSLTSDAFIAGLKRLVGRRGLPETIYSDNATNFVSAQRKLLELQKAFNSQQYQGHVSEWCSSHGISFLRIPARAPHFGGLWEAAVKSVKFHLDRSLNSTLLTYEELSTLLVQIEGILNSRPLAPLSSDPSDEQALTSGHFLIGGPLNALPEPLVLPSIDVSLNRRFQRITQLQQHFWTRWKTEYLLNLQHRYKWNSSSPNVSIGTLVLLAESNSPPQQWHLGRIIQTFPGSDGRVRVVDVQSRDKVLRRAIHTLAPLPEMLESHPATA